MSPILPALIAIFFTVTAAADTERREVEVGEVLRLAQRHSPDIRSSEAREVQALASTETLEAQYYPSLDFGMVDTFGFAGSSGSGLGIAGVIASPYRSGPATGVWSRLTVLDFTREYGLEESRLKREAARERTRIRKMSITQEALQIYFEASRLRGLAETWDMMADKTTKVAKIVDSLVDSGQHSMVSRLLIHDQEHDARMRAAVFWERYHSSLVRLGLVTGLNPAEIASPTPAHLSEDSLKAIVPGTRSPLLARAEAEARAAHTGASTQYAENLPKVLAVGSLGIMSKSRLVPEQDWSAGLAITLPLFEGFRIQSETHRAEAAALEKDHDVETARLGIDQANAKYDEIIRAARLQLRFLDEQHDAAVQAVDLSRQRYLSYLGTVVEVRECLRNLSRIETQTNDLKADLLLALASKAILNGGAVSD